MTLGIGSELSTPKVKNKLRSVSILVFMLFWFSAFLWFRPDFLNLIGVKVILFVVAMEIASFLIFLVSIAAHDTLRHRSCQHHSFVIVWSVRNHFSGDFYQFSVPISERAFHE